MNRIERISAALKGEPVDRIPISLWRHFSEVDQDPLALAETQYAYNEKFDFDFIKMMPFGLYGVQDYGAKLEIFNRIDEPPIVKEVGIKTLNDWQKIEPLSVNQGTYGKQVIFAQHLAKLTKGNTPIIQTIFSPLTTAYKLAGDRIFNDIKENPVLVKQALQAITDTTVNFIKANINAGVDGFFFATQCATQDLISEDGYREFGVPYDLQLIDSYKNATWFNFVHIHGTNTFFELVASYPVSGVNWHDRWTKPSFSEARTLTGKCLIGGIHEKSYSGEKGDFLRPSLLEQGTPAEIYNHILEAVNQAGPNRLILAPGCTVSQLAKPDNVQLFREVVGIISKQLKLQEKLIS